MNLFIFGALLFWLTSSTYLNNIKTHVAETQPLSHKLSTISATSPTSHLKSRAEERVINKDWLPSVKALSILIDEDPVLRMNWQYGISQCTKTLKGKTGDDVLDMIDAACKNPPPYSNDILAGFPLNALFV